MLVAEIWDKVFLAMASKFVCQGEKPLLAALLYWLMCFLTSSTLITAYASHSQVAAHVLQTAATKVTNLTNSPQSAVYWAYKRLTAELQIPVVVQVSGRTETSSIVVETHDIPAGNLTVLAKLKINDHARWCKIERAYTLGGKPAFKVTPFEYRLKEPTGK